MKSNIFSSTLVSTVISFSIAYIFFTAKIGNIDLDYSGKKLYTFIIIFIPLVFVLFSVLFSIISWCQSLANRPSGMVSILFIIISASFIPLIAFLVYDKENVDDLSAYLFLTFVLFFFFLIPYAIGGIYQFIAIKKGHGVIEE